MENIGVFTVQEMLKCSLPRYCRLHEVVGCLLYVLGLTVYCTGSVWVCIVHEVFGCILYRGSVWVFIVRVGVFFVHKLFGCLLYKNSLALSCSLQSLNVYCTGSVWVFIAQEAFGCLFSVSVVIVQ